MAENTVRAASSAMASASWCADARRRSESLPTYSLVDIREIKDAAKMDEYRSPCGSYGGEVRRQLSRSWGRFEVVEGTYQSARLAMLKFPSMDQARWWYDSEECRGLKQMRLAATASNGFFMTGA
jgi:uncharacterized protein (DUF1330 family)